MVAGQNKHLATVSKENIIDKGFCLTLLNLQTFLARPMLTECQEAQFLILKEEQPKGVSAKTLT